MEEPLPSGGEYEMQEFGRPDDMEWDDTNLNYEETPFNDPLVWSDWPACDGTRPLDYQEVTEPDLEKSTRRRK